MKSDPLRKFRLRTARALRANSTEAERRLWAQLRRLPIYGSHFRRQVAIGRYVADFACLRAKVLIEIDGGSMRIKTQPNTTQARTDWLQSEGYRVIRFWNSEIRDNMDAVLDSIWIALYGSRDANARSLHHPSPARSARRPSPSRGG